MTYQKTPVPFKEVKKEYQNPRSPKIIPHEISHKGISFKSSLHESIAPSNRILRVVNAVEKTIGEQPPVPLNTLLEYRDCTPQLDSVAEYLTNLIVGTDMNINADDDDAKKLCEDFVNNTGLYEKIKSAVDTSLVTGYALLARVVEDGMLTNIEESDISTLQRIHRDDFGNVKYYVHNLGGQEIKISDVENYIPIVLRKRGRECFGRSFFHSLAVQRTVGSRTTRPLVEALWSLDDVVVGTLENFAFPIEWHQFDGVTKEELEAEARKYRDRKPGDVFFVSKIHEINRREPTQARFDTFFEHASKMMQLGTGFPLEILLGDFTSRASSETTDSLLMKRVKAYQKNLLKIIKTEILEMVLLGDKSKKWDTREKINNANIQAEFEVQTPATYTPDQVLNRVNSGMWTKTEGREWDKANGQDLFDDKLINAPPEPDTEKTDLELEKIKAEIEETHVTKEAKQKILEFLEEITT